MEHSETLFYVRIKTCSVRICFGKEKIKNAAHILKHKHIQGEYDFEKEE